MDEKTMVSDTLAGINGELVRYGEMIPQTENMQLKQTLKQFRNQCEQSRKNCIRLQEISSIMFRQQKPQEKKWIT